MFFKRTFQNISRIQGVVSILLKYGFEEIVSTTPLRKLVPRQTRLSWLRENRPVFEYSRYERLRMVLEDLGPTFVKLAQIISNRPDVLPEPLIKQLERLQNNVPPFEYEKAKAIIEQETGQPLEATFEYFDQKPIGSASLGQVHRARLIGGEEVVVKVMRPKARQLVETDLTLIKDFFKLTENYFKRQGLLNPLDIITVFERTMQRELDYRNEARNMEQFRNYYQHRSDFYVPAVHKKLSTDSILVMELIRGCKITDVDTLQSWGLDPKRLAEKGMDIYLSQIFENGYFHADPHPGNVLVRHDGTICLIDFGMVGKLMKKDKYAFAGIFISMAKLDARSMALNFRRLAIESDIDDMRKFEYDLNEVIEDFASLDVEELNMSDLATALQRIIYQYKLKVPGSVFLILRAMVILEGIGKNIHPEFKTFEFVQPYGTRLVKEQYSWGNISSDVTFTLTQLLGLFSSLPFDTKEILKNIRKGTLQLRIHNTGLEPLAQSLRRATTKVSIAFMFGALFIAAALFNLSPASQEAPQWYGLSVFSIITLVLAAVMGIGWLYTIFRKH